MRVDALFIDPFAQLLAGPKALARHQKMDDGDKSVDLRKRSSHDGGPTPATQHSDPTAPQQATQQQQHSFDSQQQQVQQQLLQQQQDVPQYEGRQVSRLVLRTVFFDEATLLVTGQPAPRSRKVLAAVAEHIQQHRLQPCTQVSASGPPTLREY